MMAFRITIKKLAWVLLAGLATAPAIQAQDTSTPFVQQETRSPVLEEVIVTARKRAESIQETPVAVTAISGDDLREKGIVNSKELSKSVPSLQINDSTAAQIFIRGVGQRSDLARQDPSVSVYLDGIFIPRADGQLLSTIDVDSVQVLRGPQGTLFGKNNTGGALVFTLTKPTDSFEGYAEGALGNYDMQRARAAINLPITDTFFTRMAIDSNRRDGYLEDPSSSNNASNDRLSAIVQTRWEPSESFTLDTLAFYGRIRERYPSYFCKITSEDALFVNGLGILWPGDTDPSNPSAYRENCEANDMDTRPDLTTNQGPSQRQRRYLDDLMLGVSFDWEINDTHNLKTILGYRDALTKGPKTNSDDGGPGDFQKAVSLGDGDQESLTLEFQLNGAALDSRLEYTAGLFLQQERKTETFLTSDPIVGIDLASLIQLAAGQQPNPAFVPPGGTNPPIVGALLPLDTLQDFEIDGTTAALFAQGTFHITDNLEFTFGGRYTEETRESTLATRTADLQAVSAQLRSDPRFVPLDPALLGINLPLPIPDFGLHTFLGTWLQDPVTIANNLLRDTDGDEVTSPLGPATIDRAKTTFREFTPMASVSYFLPENLLDDTFLNSVLVYGTWSTGFKSGFQEPSGVDGLVVVEPETLENREIGFKIDALQRSLRLNVALYSMVFENMQLITVGVDSANTLVVTSTNAGESEIEGGELELSWLPSPDWLITLSYSNNNYKFNEYNDQALLPLALRGEAVSVDRSDEQFAVSPEQTASLGIQYNLLTEVGRFTPRIDVSYKSDIYLGLDRGAWEARKTNPEGVIGEQYVLIDGRLSWHNRAEDLSIAMFGKNLTDERFLIGAVATGDSIGTLAQVVGEPRMFGLEVRKQF